MILPTLYSFRRCPYAMRARLGLYFAQTSVNLREIVLKHKPEAMLQASPKGTVPVLILANGVVLEESLEIMQWALKQHDPHNLLQHDDKSRYAQDLALINQNDHVFKSWLDKYKYADRFPEHSQQYYREQAAVFILQLDKLLAQHPQLTGQQISIADLAIYPFVRQFAHVDKTWFEQSQYQHVQRWLAQHLHSAAFTAIMQKYPTWLASQQSFLFGHEHTSI